MKNSIDNLYKKGAMDTSPTALDNLIINQAKQSCEAHIVTTKKSRRWLYSLSTAAVFVMGFSVVFNLQNQNTDLQISPKYETFESTKQTVQKQTTTPRPSQLPLEPHPAPKKVEARKERTNKKLAKSKENIQPVILGEIISENKEIDSSNSTNRPRQKNTPTLADGYKIKGKDDRIPSLAKAQAVDNIANLETEKKLPESETIIEEEQAMIQGSTALLDSEVVNSGLEESDSQDKDEKLGRVIVTGSRISKVDQKISNDIERLENLINLKHYAKAKKLIKELKDKHPDYNFSNLEKLIK